MGVTTDFIGHVDIAPALNDAEQAYLAAFTLSRRCRRDGGPYAVPGNPAAEGLRPLTRFEIGQLDDAELAGETERVNEVAEGQPSFWCDWEICWSGCCLTYSGVEKFYGSTRWLEYLIDHFLRPDALAASSPLSYFAAFTFDHHLDGMFATSRRSDKQMTLIHVTDNMVSEEVLRLGDRRYEIEEQLAYEAYLDRARAERAKVRRPRPTKSPRSTLPQRK